MNKQGPLFFFFLCTDWIRRAHLAAVPLPRDLLLARRGVDALRKLARDVLVRVAVLRVAPAQQHEQKTTGEQVSREMR